MHTLKAIPSFDLLRKTSVILTSLFLVFGCSGIDEAVAQAVNEPAPEFQVYTMDGRFFSPYSLDEQALLMFWAPWCGVCRSELPKLARYYRETGFSGLQVLTIGTSASRDRVTGYVKDQPDTFVFPTVYDDGRLLAEAFGIRAFPTYVLIDIEGTIQMIHRGGGVLNSRKFQALVE